MEPGERHPVQSRRGISLEIAVWWTVCLILLYLSSVLGGLGGIWAENAGTLPAAFCLLFPVIWAGRKGVPLDLVGIHGHGWGRALGTAGLAMLAVFPFYIVGYELWRHWTVGLPGGMFAALGNLGRISPMWLANLVFVQVFAVALPEEIFYRGWMQWRLATVFRGRVRLLGVPFGWNVVVTAALFGLSHLVVVPAPFRLAVFFPALLFGWLREKTGSVIAPIVFHAACNILLAVLQQIH